MKNGLTTSWLVLTALLALSAAATSPASAHEFSSSKTPVVLTGEEHVNKFIYSIGSAKVECEEVTLVARFTASPIDTITMSPQYGKCVFEPFGAATIAVNHCAYVFDSDTNAEGHAPLDIECSGTDAITITAPGCTVKVGAQTGVSGVSYTNVKTGSIKEITGHTTAKNIAYTKSGISCFLISGEMQYNGTFTLKGYESNKAPSGTELTTPANYGHNGTQVDVTTEGDPPSHDFTSSKTPAVLTGEDHVNPHVLSIGSAKVECEETKFVARATASPVDTITVAPTYGGCSAGALGEAVIDTNHCAYVLDSDTTGEHAPLDIECNGEEKIIVEVSGCAITIGAQSGLSGIRYTNATAAGPKKEITGHLTVKNIAYSKSGASCSEITGEAQYNGTFTVKGYESNKAPSGTELTTPVNYGHNGTQVDATVEGAPDVPNVDHSFTAGKTPVVLTGEEHAGALVLSIGSAKMECEEVSFVGRATASPTDTTTVAPIYTGCSLSPLGKVVVDVNHCAYELDSDTGEGEHAPVGIECNGSEKILIEASGCAITIGAQSGLSGIHFTTAKTGSKNEITANLTVKNIAYSKSGASCSEITGEAQYNGAVTLKGYESSKSPSGTELTTPSWYAHNGTQVDVSISTP